MDDEQAPAKTLPDTGLLHLPDLSGVNGPESTILDEMAGLLAKHKLIPFFGAGISRQHLGFAAAELAQEIAPRVGKPPETLLSQLADDFVDQFGEAAFINFLKAKLVLPEVDDAKVSAHRLLLSLSLNLLYTTNQDNLFELVAKNYGRRYRCIVTLDDLSDSVPGEPLLIKFHGDPDAPSSLVFGRRSYTVRMKTENHPLDIKLRADLLGKRLLFVGYSFQDENVTKLLSTVQRAFAGQLPPSYLLAFDYDPSMDDLHRTYGIQVINPRQLCPAATTNADAFERCLKVLCDRTITIQAARGLEMLFSDQKINPRMATEFEVQAIANVVETQPIDTALSAFRAVFDGTRVPTSLQRQVTDIFRQLTMRIDPASDKQTSELRGALFNLHLPVAFALEALANVMAVSNRRLPREGFDDFVSISCPAVPDGTHPVAAAMAVTLLLDRQEAITDSFRRLATFWFQGFQTLEPKIQEMVKATIAAAWPGSKAPESPLNRPPFPMRAKGYHEILNDLQSRFPKKFKSPEE